MDSKSITMDVMREFSGVLKMLELSVKGGQKRVDAWKELIRQRNLDTS